MTDTRRRSGPKPPLTLDSEITYLKGAGPAVAQRLRALDLRCVRDLLFHLPARYEDRRRHTPCARLRPDTDALVRGRIVAVDVRFAGKRSLRVVVDDGTGGLLLRFFHFRNAQAQGFVAGAGIRVWGVARMGPGGWEMVHPEYRAFPDIAQVRPEGGVRPVYPLAVRVKLRPGMQATRTRTPLGF